MEAPSLALAGKGFLWPVATLLALPFPARSIAARSGQATSLPFVYPCVRA
jgi:hypothetical protein